VVKTVRDAHFLIAPASDLPYVYLGVGVLTTVVALLFTRITQGRALWESLAGARVFVAITLMGFARLLRLDAPWVPITSTSGSMLRVIVIAQSGRSRTACRITRSEADVRRDRSRRHSRRTRGGAVARHSRAI
jgi:hypothetical protein